MAIKMDVKQFFAEIRVESKAMKKKEIEPFGKFVSSFILKGIVDKTPVVTGNTKANWQVGINEPKTAYLEGVDPGGATTIAIGVLEIAGSEIGDTIIITNNRPDVAKLEQGASDQAPQGMIAVTLQEAETKFADVASVQRITR